MFPFPTCFPYDFKVITKVPKSTREEMENAVESAKAAYKTWSKTSILTRQQVMLRYQHIIRNNMVYEVDCYLKFEI
jgi:malonate-semialdehyde dehydrogenase (acetylating)/methylmalonate-semialdehyde dehydrogenase